MTYKAFYEEAETPRHIHPYLLKEYNNRWFVYAYTDEYKGEGVYGLDRIIRVEKIKKRYRKPAKTKIIEYFKDIIGVTNFEDKEVEDIVLKVNRARANYLITKPIHKSQKVIKETSNHVFFSFRLKPNHELNAFILGYGKDIVVEKPKSLAHEIKTILSEAVGNYEKN
jgi:predicted DNA-binding transcriptional regulator YafY